MSVQGVTQRPRLSLWFPMPGRRTHGPTPKLERMARQFCVDHDLLFREFVGPAHHRDIAHHRQRFMSEAYETGLWSLPRIGRMLGGRHHTTVLHGIRAYQARSSHLLSEANDPETTPNPRNSAEGASVP